MIKKLVFILAILVPAWANAKPSIATDQLYRDLIESVKLNDFKLMTNLYHNDAVVVSAQKSELITHAIKRWDAAGKKLYADGGYASLEMRFKDRVVGDNSSYESGIYHYKTVDKNQKVIDLYMHFEDLNVLKDGQWLIVMERNVKRASLEEFEQLPVFN